MMETIPADQDVRIIRQWDNFFADYDYFLLERRTGLSKFFSGEWKVRTSSFMYSIALIWSERYEVEIEE